MSPMDEIASFVCKSCNQYMKPPVRQCTWCFSMLCSPCASTRYQCPRCFRGRKFRPDFAFDQLIHSLQLPCRNEFCDYTTRCDLIRKHEQSCVYKKTQCLLSDCRFWAKTKNGLIRHCKAFHPDKVLVADRHTFLVGCEDNLVFFDAFNQFFALYYSCDVEESVLKFKMCYHSVSNVRFVFEVVFGDYVGQKCTETFRFPCLRLKPDDFTLVDFFDVDFDDVARFSVDKDLCFKVRIKILR